MPKEFKPNTQKSINPGVPAASYLNPSAVPSRSGRTGRPPKDPKDRKTHRLNLTVTESVYDDLKYLAALGRTSINEYISEIVKKEAEQNREKITAYRELMK